VAINKMMMKITITIIIIIIGWIFRKCDVAVWTGSSWSRIKTGGGNL
jgi:hypothetical protein